MAPMQRPNVWQRNREILADLIYARDAFTTDDLIAELRQHSADGSATIDGGQTVAEYLDELRQLGALEGSRIHGHWRVLGSRGG